MRMMKAFCLVAVVLAVCSWALAADAYKIDPVHSRVGFSVRHMAVSTVHGRFTDFSGSIVYDEQDPAKSSVAVTIQAPSITTENAYRDNDLRSPHFLDAVKFPEITFKSNSVEKKGDGYVAHGTLTIHGVAKNVDLPFTLSGPLATQKGKLLGAEAGLTINRQDYGVTWNGKLAGGELVVSNDVKIDLSVEADQVKPPAQSGK